MALHSTLKLKHTRMNLLIVFIGGEGTMDSCVEVVVLFTLLLSFLIGFFLGGRHRRQSPTPQNPDDVKWMAKPRQTSHNRAPGLRQRRANTDDGRTTC